MEQFLNIHTEYWNFDYSNPCILDGTQWELSIHYSDNYIMNYSGNISYPENWNELLDFFKIKQDDEFLDE